MDIARNAFSHDQPKHRRKSEAQIRPAHSPELRQIPSHRLQTCQRLQAEQAMVNNAFGSIVKSRPAWEMLLALYSCSLGCHAPTLTDLASFCSTANSTASRIIHDMAAEGILELIKDRRDKRRVYVLFQPAAYEKLHALFDEFERLLIATQSSS